MTDWTITATVRRRLARINDRAGRAALKRSKESTPKVRKHGRPKGR